jgi:hypothetical protein
LRLPCERAEKGTEKVPQKISGASEEAGAVVEQVKSSS